MSCKPLILWVRMHTLHLNPGLRLRAWSGSQLRPSDRTRDSLQLLHLHYRTYTGAQDTVHKPPRGRESCSWKVKFRRQANLEEVDPELSGEHSTVAHLGSAIPILSGTLEHSRHKEGKSWVPYPRHSCTCALSYLVS